MELNNNEDKQCEYNNFNDIMHTESTNNNNDNEYDVNVNVNVNEFIDNINFEDQMIDMHIYLNKRINDMGIPVLNNPKYNISKLLNFLKK
jgi:hypothetical protein